MNRQNLVFLPLALLLTASEIWAAPIKPKPVVNSPDSRLDSFPFRRSETTEDTRFFRSNVTNRKREGYRDFITGNEVDTFGKSTLNINYINLGHSKTGHTPLHDVIIYGRRGGEFTEELLAKGADPNLLNKEGYTPATLAISRIRIRKTDSLDSKKKSKSTDAAERATSDKLELQKTESSDRRRNAKEALLALLRYRKDKNASDKSEAIKPKLNTKDGYGDTPLLAVSRLYFGGDLNANETLEIFEALFAPDLGTLASDPNIRDKRGWTALHYVVAANEDGFTELIKKLLDAKADANLPDFDGVTPMLLAAQRCASTQGYKKVIQLLVGSETRLYQDSSHGLPTALDFAMANGRKQIFETFGNRGISTSVKNFGLAYIEEDLAIEKIAGLSDENFADQVLTRDRFGLGLLHVVALQGKQRLFMALVKESNKRADTCKTELQKRACTFDVTARDRLGRSPIFFLMRSMSPDNPSVETDCPKSAFAPAVAANTTPDVLKYLLNDAERKAKPKERIRPLVEPTPADLMVAVENEDASTAKLLINSVWSRPWARRLLIETPDEFEVSPLTLARSKPKTAQIDAIIALFESALNSLEEEQS